MRDEIKFVGINAQLNDYECKDGELYATAGLWMDEVSLQGLALPAVQFSVGAGLRLMGVHETSAFKHWLLVGEDSMSGDVGWYLYWVDSDVTGEVTKEALTAAGQRVAIGREEIRRVGSIGNVVLCMTDSGIHYVLWKSDLERDGSGEGGVVCVHEGSYKDLGTHLPEVPISFGLRGVVAMYPKNFNDAYQEFQTEDNGDIKDSAKTAVNTYLKGIMNKLIADEAVGKGRFCFPFLVRYAYRLYDGTTTMLSAPVLMKPSTMTAPALLRFNADYDQDHATVVATGIMSSLDYYAYDQAAVKDLKEWEGIVTGVDIFVSAPIYTYDQAGEMDNLVRHEISEGGLGKWVGRRDWMANDEYIWRDTGKTLLSAEPFVDYEWRADAGYIEIPQKSAEKVAEEVRSCGDFYLLKSLTLDDLVVSGDDMAQHTERRVVQVDDDYLRSLLQRERLEDDYGSHDLLAADVAYSYNNRMNLAGLRRQRFGGFPARAMLNHVEVKDTDHSTWGGSRTDTINTTMYALRGYWRLKPPSGEMTVKDGSALGQLGIYEDALRGAYLYYPALDCDQGQLANETHATPVFSVPMKPHAMLNGSVWFEGFDSIPGTVGVHPSAGDAAWEPMEDKIYTSAINNPFTFPLSGINTIPGGGKVIGIASATKALSEGQFGQFPLYAFTTYGVWALEVNGQTAGYSARQPIGRDVCVDGDSITQTDDAVLFVTDRGLMMVTSSKISCLSDKIKGGTVPLDGEADGAQVDVQSYLRGCSMVYDYIGQRVLLFNPDYDYNLVYSMRSGEWGGGALGVTGKVDCWPASAIITAGGVEGRADVRMTDGGQDPDAWLVDGWLVTRPLKLRAGGDVLKTVRSVIVRGVFREGHVQVELEGSRDLFIWHRIWSSATHRVRGYSGTPWKYFRLRIYASLERDESLTGASVDYVVKYLGKMR